MKPMILKEPAKCCGTPMLLWNRTVFICPCGQMKADLNGRLKVDRPDRRGNKQSTFANLSLNHK